VGVYQTKGEIRQAMITDSSLKRRREQKMPNLTMSIPHQLGRAEAKRRIQEQAAQAQQQYGNLLGQVNQRWTGDTLDFMVLAAGQSVTGQVTVEEQVVKVAIALPWMFALLASAVRQKVEHQGQLLLGHQPSKK
jgi:hypothetical protein